MLKDPRTKENLSLVFVFAMLVVFFVAIYFLLGKEIMLDMFLLTIYAGSFSLLGIVIIYGIYSNPSTPELKEEMSKLKQDIKGLEIKFLKRNITEQSFIKLLSKKHQRLIKVEAKIYRRTSPLKLTGLKAGLMKRRDRAALKRLMEEKGEILEERRLASCKLYRRQIDRNTFTKFIEENDDALVKTESLIKILFARAIIPSQEKKRDKIIREIVKEDKIDFNRMSKELAEQSK